MSDRRSQPRSLFSAEMLLPAVKESVRKLDPRHMVRNPVMFVVEIGAVITSAIWLIQAFGGSAPGKGADPAWYTLTVSIWLWLTVLFGNLAEAIAEGRGKAQAATAERARLVPVFLASVPLQVPLDTPLPGKCNMAVPRLEAIEQRAAKYGVPIDARIERGRDRRHALRETIAHETYDRVVIAASAADSHGFHSDDVAWLLDHALGEVVVLRPAKEKAIRVDDPAVCSRDGSRALATQSS
jgi:hypothetical protein